MTNEFISRLHTPDFDTDYYKILGKTSLEKHVSDFHKINWEEDFWGEYDSGNFNMSDLEVFNVNDLKYLAIRTAPNTDTTYQFIIGLGTHTETNISNEPKRKVKLYYTEKESREVPLRFIEYFFKGDYEKINKELAEYDVDEIEDVYYNIE
jgi:hypothetical protein